MGERRAPPLAWSAIALPVLFAGSGKALHRKPLEQRASRLAAAARTGALERHGRELMNRRYEDLFLELAR